MVSQDYKAARIRFAERALDEWLFDCYVKARANRLARETANALGADGVSGAAGDPGSVRNDRVAGGDRR